MKAFLKKIPTIKVLVVYIKTLRNKYNFFQKTILFFDFLKDFRDYKNLEKNIAIPTDTANL